MYQRSSLLGATFSTLFLTLLFRDVTAQETCFPGYIRVGSNCTVCPPGTFSDSFNRLSCSLCPYGTFQPIEGAQSEDQCQACASGTFSRKEGSAVCKRCPAGEDSLPKSRACGFCPPGSALNQFALDGCWPCEPAFFADQPGSRFCKPCPNGTFAKRDPNPALRRKAGATKCTKCPAGTSRRNPEFNVMIDQETRSRNNVCERCEPGTFSDKDGADSCKLCRPGTFSTGGATSCTVCPSGSFSAIIPAKSCKPCATGTSTQSAGAAACKRAGKPCPSNTFENAAGACESCMPGERLDVRKQQCVACSAGEVSAGGADTVCRKCAQNMVPLDNRSFQEKSECVCARGYFLSGNECFACPAGTFGENPRSRNRLSATGIFGYEAKAECSPCPLGAFSDMPGALFCKKCPPGTFQDTEGQTGCMACPPGSDSPVLGRFFTFSDREVCIVTATGCRAGEKRTREGKCQVETCPSTYTALFNKECIACNSDTRLNARRGCVNCDRRSFSTGGATTTCLPCPVGLIPNGGACTCPWPLLKAGGTCMRRRCPGGTEPVRRQVLDADGRLTDGEVCEACGPRQYSVRGDLCRPCQRDRVPARGKKRCARCPVGLVVGTDIFGRRLGECVEDNGSV